MWTVDGPLKRRTKELLLKLESFGFLDLEFTGHGIRVIANPTSGGYKIAFDGLMGPLRILTDGSFINMTGKGFREVPELIEQVFAAIEKHSAKGKAAESRELGPESLEKSNFRIDSANWGSSQKTEFKVR